MREKEFLPLIEPTLGIAELNEMQRAMLASADKASQGLMLTAPTGSGKTLAFALPLLKLLNPAAGRVQAVVLAPGRELVLQIAGVLRKLAPAYRLVNLYGGHPVSDEVNSLKVTPDVVAATPGRLLDHIHRRNIDVMSCRIVVLDEYDKMLSLGFEKEMEGIFRHLKNVSRVILTSATEAPSVPDFLPVSRPVHLDYGSDEAELRERVPVYVADADSRDKLVSLLGLLHSLAGPSGVGRTAIFVNHRESAERVHGWLLKRGAPSVLYHGALDQQAREKALALFRAGSRPLLVTTDLGARGLDVEGVDHVVHYHLPLTPDDWIHRNGRTARAGANGDIYVLRAPGESLPEYMEPYSPANLSEHPGAVLNPGLETLRVSAGRREKVSRGDLLGWLVKECGVEAGHIGRLEVADHFALATLPAADAAQVLARGKNQRIKGAQRRVSPA